MSATNCAAMSCSTLLNGPTGDGFGDRGCKGVGGGPWPPNGTRSKRDDPWVRRCGVLQNRRDGGLSARARTADDRGRRAKRRQFCGLAERRSAVTEGRGHQQLPVPPWQPCRAKHVPPNNVNLIADATLPRNRNGDRRWRERRVRKGRRY